MSTHDQQFKERMDLLDILGRADRIVEGDYSDCTYFFNAPGAVVALYHYSLDGDTTVTVTQLGQEFPLLKFELVDCQDIRLVNDKRGEFIEFVGQLKVFGEYARRRGVRNAGFRLFLKPHLCVEPFLMEP